DVTNPYLNYKMSSKIVTIPLELTTALRLLYCTNFTVGFGADLVMGKTDVKFGMDGGLKLTGGTATTPGRIEVAGGTKSSPSIVKPKLMAGIGIGIVDALVIDMPLTVYWGSGFDIGITIGTVW
ncbi:MAG: hypothetical protein FWG13_07235, partial [Leptospirales bacterium]|nr:hypothetical protein [Leptospirales bacterium]